MPHFFSLARTSARGSALVEVAVVFVILAFAMVGSYFVLYRGSDFGKISESRIKAINLAREGMEIVTNIRDTNWKRFSSDYPNCWRIENYNSTCVGGNAPASELMSGTYRITSQGELWALEQLTTNILGTASEREDFRVFLTSTGTRQGIFAGTNDCINDSLPAGGICRLKFWRDITITPNGTGQMDVRSRVVWFDPPQNTMTNIVLEKTLTNWAENLR